MHAKSQHGLRVKPSQIQNAGLGLYATKRLAKNARIAPYTGETQTRAQVKAQYGTDTGRAVEVKAAQEAEATGRWPTIRRTYKATSLPPEPPSSMRPTVRSHGKVLYPRD